MCCASDASVVACATSRYNNIQTVGLDVTSYRRLCEIAENRDLLFEVPFNPADPTGPMVSCVEEKELRIARRRFNTYGTTRCEEDVVGSCEEFPDCAPATGLCPPATPIASSSSCELSSTGTPVPTPTQCGTGLCNGVGAGCTEFGCPLSQCVLTAQPSSECPEIALAPSMVPPLFRNINQTVFRQANTVNMAPPFPDDEHVIYRLETLTPVGIRSRELQSCHWPICTGTLDCAVALDPSQCPPAPAGSCLVSQCTASTVDYVGNVIGCRRVPVNSKCVPPTGNQCLVGTCLPTGTCTFNPNDSLCGSVPLPPGNECLRRDCGDNGQCGTRRDHLSCDVLPCSELGNRFCRADGKCASSCEEINE